MTTSERAVTRHSRRREWRTLAALLAVFALIAAACGGDDGEDDGASATEPAPETTEAVAPETTQAPVDAAPSGEPIKVMTVTTLNAAGPTYHNIANTANAYADYINARGGIGGRPLEVTVCDEMFDPAVAAACAREAVEESVVAVVGSFTFFAESIVPVIAELMRQTATEC